MHHTFFYISLPSLHNYDVKMPNFTFYGGRKQARKNFFLSLPKLECGAQEIHLHFDIFIELAILQLWMEARVRVTLF